MPYFDWNATALLHPDARAAWLEALDQFWGNPSTAYRAGARARLALDEARETVASCLRVPPDSVVFTSGATEANNGFIREAARRAKADARISISAIEHPCVRAAASHFWGNGRVIELPVDRTGRLDFDRFHDQIRKTRPSVVSVMAANNETGVVQPWERIQECCRDFGLPFHCDASQWIGKEGATDWSGCAAVTFSAHKFGGPRGVGGLVLSPEWKGIRILSGGAQEMDMRAGTENVPAIVATAAAMRARFESPPLPSASAPRDAFESALSERWPDEGLHIHGRGAPRLWNTCSLALPHFPAARWITRLDRKGFEVSSGSACSTGRDGPSPVLAAMGLNPELMRRTLRISGGWETRAEDWEALREAIFEIHQALLDSDKPEGPGQVIEI